MENYSQEVQKELGEFLTKYREAIRTQKPKPSMVLGKIRFVRKHPSIPNYQFLECPITLVANIDREFPFNVESFDVAGRSLGLLSRTIHVIVTCADNTTYRDEFSFELYEELLRISIEETKGDES